MSELHKLGVEDTAVAVVLRVTDHGYRVAAPPVAVLSCQSTSCRECCSNMTVWRADDAEVCRYWSLGSSTGHAHTLGLSTRGGALPAGGPGEGLWPDRLPPHGPESEGRHD